MGMHVLIHSALEGNPVAWFAPSYKFLSDVWRQLQTTLAPAISSVNQQEHRIELLGGGSIDMWSLDSPDAGRGRAYAMVVIDEAAMAQNLEQGWQHSIRPTLMDWLGEAWFLSTPKGMSFFKTLFDWGQDPEKTDWASWQMPTVENPYIPDGEIESARMDLAEAIFNQEFLALFVNWEGSVFRRVHEATRGIPGLARDPTHDYAIGCDWGRSRDYTVFIVVDLTAHSVVAMDRSNRVDYSLQSERLKALAEEWQPVEIIAEQNSMGQPIIEQLSRDGMPIRAFYTSNASKAKAIEDLVLAFERGQIQILNDPVLVSELIAYQAERLPSGQLRYGAPSGQHDDTVMALALAWTAVCNQQCLLYPIPDSTVVVTDFAIPDHWPRACAVDIRWNHLGAIWGARDPETDTVYLYCEYSAEAETATHVSAIGSRGQWIPKLIELTANARSPSDGARLVQLYRELGLTLVRVDSPLESGILNVLQRMQSGRLKVFGSLAKYLEERRLYHRNEKGEIAKEHDSLQDAARCLVNNISRFSTKPKPRRVSPNLWPIGNPSQAWMAN